ncbi:hypothetical protein WA158_004600 [Blastocystis sp. Blastoise]
MDKSDELVTEINQLSSVDEFREKISKWQDSSVLKILDKDDCVIENERADILADKIHELASRKKRKMIYRELQKIIMLPSPVDPSQITNCLTNIEKNLEHVGSSLIPWLNAYFKGLKFPEDNVENLQESKKESDILTDITSIFFKDWNETHYDGFQWRINVLRDCLDAYLTDEEHNQFYNTLTDFTSIKHTKKNMFKLFTDLKSQLSSNPHGSDVLALFQWVVKGERDLPLVSIAPITEPEVRSRDAERHTLLAAYHKYKFHTLSPNNVIHVSAEQTQILYFRLATVLTDEQHIQFVNRLKRYQNVTVKDEAVDRFINDVGYILGPLSYLILPSLKECVNDLSIPQLEYIRKMKTPVMTVKAVRRYSLPGVDLPSVADNSNHREDIDVETNKDIYSRKTKEIQDVNEPYLKQQKDGEAEGERDINRNDQLEKNKLKKEEIKRKRQIFVFSPVNQQSLAEKELQYNDYKVFVSNLPQGVYAEELAASFQPCGNVTKVEILDFTPNPPGTPVKKTIRKRQITVDASSLDPSKEMKTMDSVPVETNSDSVEDVESSTDTNASSTANLEDTVVSALIDPEVEEDDEIENHIDLDIKSDDVNEDESMKEEEMKKQKEEKGKEEEKDKEKEEVKVKEKVKRKRTVLSAKGKGKIDDEPTPDTKIVGFIHFSDIYGKMRALDPCMRLLGVCIRENLCRTEPAENKRTLYVGNIPPGLTGDEVASSINKTLPPSYQICMQNIQQDGIVATSAGFCFIEFDSHDLACTLCDMLSGAEINGQKLKVCWALDNTDQEMKKRKRFLGYRH